MTENTYPVFTGKEHGKYLGYTFYRNGTVISPAGRRLKTLEKDKFSGNHVTLITKTNGRRLLKRVNLARIIYSMFSGRALTKNDIITFKNRNPSDCRFENLKKVTMKEYLKETKGMKAPGRKHMFTKKQTERIKEQHRAGKNFVQLASKHRCSVVTIQKICGGTYFKDKTT